jgi:3-deoxy-7-phosphoheptulonate synthase
MNMPWSPSSWRTRPFLQYVEYPDRGACDAVLAALARLPPLVTSWEVEALKSQLAQACRGDAFLLQGGDCSETFEDCQPGAIVSKLKILLKLSVLLVYGCGQRVIRVGRCAGQYAKPRSSVTETVDGVTLPSYRGNLINHKPFTKEARTPDPTLLLRGYERAALTLNFIRSLVAGGFADLHHPEFWDLEFVNHSSHSHEYRQMMEAVTRAVSFTEAVAGRSLAELHGVEFFVSHEGLHLDYEQAQTRQVPRREGWYDLTTHFPWIGDRTRNLEGAHVEFFRGIANPIGVKIGPSCSPDELLALTVTLNPQNEPGRLTLIHRFGADRIEACLPPLIEAVHQAGRVVLWCCDPMHGNTLTTKSGLKTRRFDDILKELDLAFEIHAALGNHLGGAHFELTGENVTECLGGARGLTEEDLSKSFLSDVDPRLNYEQAMEMALAIARRMARSRSAGRTRGPQS